MIASGSARQRVGNFYDEYHGHRVSDLRVVLDHLRSSGGGDRHRHAVFLAGDSSLDNKFWVEHTARGAPGNGYESILRPDSVGCVQDVAYHVNACLVQAGQDLEWFCINAAVEESALCDRDYGRLLPQDEFVREEIASGDVLVVSVGGNDIALKPSMWTIAHILVLVNLVSMRWLQSCADGTAYMWPRSLAYFVDMFSTRVKAYVERLVAKTKPRRVVICMIYYPLELQSQPTWADTALRGLGYNSNPAKLQLVIRTIFALATSKIRIEGTQVVPFALYSVLDGKTAADYSHRVEPSGSGGLKMARALTPVAVLEAVRVGAALSLQ